MTPNVKNILEMLEKAGEERLKPFLGTFSSPLNPSIENFIKNKAIDFARRKLSITYLVIDLDDGQILGYFALTHKALLISNSQLSNTSRKKLERFARLDKATGDYMASAFLIAQFGKNYGADDGKRITGRQLMDVANDVLLNIQRQIGGGIIYLDCEDIEKLKNFYVGENFQLFGERFSEEDNQKYLQYMRFF